MPERPVELIYALEETPPWPHLLAIGFQHVAVICPYLVMVALVAEAAKLPHDAAQSAVGLAMIAVAFMTVLQSLRLGPVGSGYLCAWSIAFWLILLSCLPKFAGLIVNMPRPVMAAALFFNCALMLVAGIQIVASRPITLRATLIIGFSILAAMTAPVYPDFYRSLPSWTQQFTGSIISMAVVVSVPLNALFLLGTWHYSLLRLGTDSTPATARSFDAFFEKQAKEWKIPAEDAARVRSVVDTAIEYVTANANGPVEIQVGSDTFDISVKLRYMGNLPSLPDARPKKEMVEEQSFVSGLTGYLSGLHADRIERSAKGEQCEIKLLFRL
jgi:xanthine permease XanP